MCVMRLGIWPRTIPTLFSELLLYRLFVVEVLLGIQEVEVVVPVMVFEGLPSQVVDIVSAMPYLQG